MHMYISIYIYIYTCAYMYVRLHIETVFLGGGRAGPLDTGPMYMLNNY